MINSRLYNHGSCVVSLNFDGRLRSYSALSNQLPMLTVPPVCGYRTSRPLSYLHSCATDNEETIIRRVNRETDRRRRCRRPATTFPTPHTVDWLDRSACSHVDTTESTRYRRETDELYRKLDWDDRQWALVVLSISPLHQQQTTSVMAPPYIIIQGLSGSCRLAIFTSDRHGDRFCARRYAGYK